MTIAPRNACCLLPAECSLSAGRVLWHDNDSPALQMPRRSAPERASRLITMTMWTLRAGLTRTLHTRWPGWHSRLKWRDGGFDFSKMQTDGRGSRSIFVSTIMEPFSTFFLFNRASGWTSLLPWRAPSEPLPLSLCLTVCCSWNEEANQRLWSYSRWNHCTAWVHLVRLLERPQ